MVAEKEKEARLLKSRNAKRLLTVQRLRLKEREAGQEGQKGGPIPIPEENCQHGDHNEAAG